MVGNDEVLLDAFVSIKPDKDFLSAIDNVTDAAIKRMQEKFGDAVIKGPNVVAGQSNASQAGSIQAEIAKADARREASARRILDLQKQIDAILSKNKPSSINTDLFIEAKVKERSPKTDAAVEKLKKNIQASLDEVADEAIKIGRFDTFSGPANQNKFAAMEEVFKKKGFEFGERKDFPDAGTASIDLVAIKSSKERLLLEKELSEETQREAEAKREIVALNNQLLGSSQQQSSLEAERTKTDDRREAAARRILDLTKEIEKLSRPGASTFTPATKARALEEERKAYEALQKAQKEYARLLSANDPTVASEDAAIQKQIVDYQKERNQAEKDHIEALKEVEQAQLKVARSNRPEKSKFTEQSVADARAERDRLLAAGAGEGPIALAQKNLETEERGRAKYLETRGKEAVAVQDELTAAIQRSAEAEARRIALSAEIVTDTDQLAKARIAAEQKVAEAAERAAAAKENVARQEQGAEKYAETRAAKLITAQAALVAAMEDEADAKKQLVVLNDQISASIQQQIAQTNALSAAAQAAASAQATAANPPGGNTPIGPTNPLGGGGRQGGGGGGNPPANPPGANPPGGPNPPGLGSQFRDVRREVENLEESLRQLNLVKTEIKTDATKKDLQLIDTQLREINVILQRGSEDADPFALQEALNRLPSLEQRLRRLNVDISATRALRSEFDDLRASGTEQIQGGRLRANVAQSQIRGLPSGDIRQAILLQTAAVREQELQVARLSKTFDGTSEAVERLRGSIIGLSQAQDALDETQQLAQQTGRSFNTLSNNAYQLGQAIEDFSVGFSLNGFAGGVRGAANNVAFLLNDVSRLASVQKALPAGWAQQLPLIAGIGSALAILVLPKLVEWLESLNDVQVKFNDIAEEIQRSFEDIDFNIDLGQNNTDLLRTVNSAESVRDVLKAIQDLSNESGDIKSRIQQVFTGFTESGDLAKTTREISELQKVFTETINGFQSSLDSPGAKGVLDSLLGSRGIVEQGLQETLDLLGPIRSEIIALNKDINDVVTAGAAGNATPDQLKKTEQQIFEFRKKLKQRTEDPNLGLDFSDTAGIENLDKTLEVVQSRLKAASEDAQKLANIVDTQVQLAFDAAARKVTELQDQLDLSRAVALDINVDFDLDLLALDAQINEGRRILTESISAIRESAKSRGVPVNEAGIKTLEEEFKVRSLLSVEQLQSTNLKEREKLEERILELKEKQRQSAKFTTLEEFAKNLQINALSGNDEESRRRKRLEEAQREREQNLEDFRRIQEARGAIEGWQGFGDAATRPRVLEGSAGTGFQPFFGDIMKQFTESAMNFQQPDNQQLKPEDIKQAVSDGVREGMKVLSEGFGGKAVDALKNLKGVAVTQ